MCFGFLTYKAYKSYSRNQKIKINDIILPLIFTVSIVAVLIFAFNGINVNAI
jgi:hypothetical protein